MAFAVFNSYIIVSTFRWRKEMTTPISRVVLYFVVVAAVTAFGLGSAGARARECGCTVEPDMTAFGFVANYRTCDGYFVRKAEEANMLDIALGEKARELAASTDVQHFGQMMATDHMNAGNRLLAISRKTCIEYPRDMHMVEDYSDEVRLYEQMANDSVDPDLGSYARQTLPTLCAHLRMAREIYSRLES
jgi:putative membrane protein